MVADLFNEFFVNVAASLKQPLKHSNFEKLTNFINSKVNDDVSFNIPLINYSFVSSYLSLLDATKSTGLDYRTKASKNGT